MNVMTIIGTRPEAIKMAPVIRSLGQNPHVNSIVCSTGQHKQMLNQVTEFFGFSIDIDLEIMTEKQDLFDITAKSLVKLRDIIKEVGPDRILVHGDTTTCLAGAMAGFYSGVEVGHVEAGLRTYNLQAPFPEEANRSMVSRIANYHFCPTAQAKNNLLSEGINEQSIFVTGNTVIDALLWGNEIINARYGNQHWAAALGENLVERIKSPARKMALITGHRRENLGKGFDGICDAIKKLSEEYPEIDFVYPVHLNPKVRQPVAAALGSSDNIHLIEPQDYATFIWLMNRSHIILTDSGGIQEEAPSLNKPVLVMRDVTERPEAIEAGTVKLVGTNSATIVDSFRHLADNTANYNQMASSANPFGDGTAAQQIVEHLLQKKGIAAESCAC